MTAFMTILTNIMRGSRNISRGRYIFDGSITMLTIDVLIKKAEKHSSHVKV